MLRINQVKLHPGHSTEDLEKKICKILWIHPEELLSYTIQKQSLDARKKPNIFFSYTIDVQVTHEERVMQKAKNQVQKSNTISFTIPFSGTEPLPHRPVVVGSGPAGLFCTYLLAKAGYRPLLLERGKCVEERTKDVETFWSTGLLDPTSNVQFGEGGAGTFSDGKLNTLVKDSAGRNRFVLETLCAHGAPKHILYEQKPHIGTDILTDVVKNIRTSIQNLGGEIRFQSQLTNFVMKPLSDNQEQCLSHIIINGDTKLNSSVLVLAIGHSARDTFQMLFENQLQMEAKSFAVGVRIEHKQSMINHSQYGTESVKHLPVASYKLTAPLSNGRSAYTFCMCPGGYVVNASSEKQGLAVNGMSYHDRAGLNANSAVIITVSPEDYGCKHPLSGIEFQKKLEKKAWEIGNGSIPIQTFSDFCNNRTTTQLGTIQPECKGLFSFANVRSIFPEEIGNSLEEGILSMNQKIAGFASPDAILSGVESRTSSPVKMLRDSNFESSIKGVYPCGEGAGYAGGITSAAMDGIKTAEAIIKRFALPI